MAKSTTKRKSKSTSPTCQNLIEQLKFVSLAQKAEDDIPWKVHCVMHNGLIGATNGTITIGSKIDETLEVAANTFKLIAALERTTKDVSITELEGRLSVRSGSFSCFVPCWHEAMPTLSPDPPLCAISDTLRAGFESIAAISVDNDKKRIVECSILLRENSMVSTDGALMLEFWHNHSLPTMVLPKAFVTAILNTDKKLKAFGYGQKEVNGQMIGVSCTFHFEDDSYIKTQLYDEGWPSVDIILNKPSKPEPLPAGFYDALRNIKPFSEGKELQKTVYFVDGALQSHRDKQDGAVCEVPGVKHGPAFNIKRLERIEHCMNTVDFYSSSAAFFFSKDGLTRGVLAGVSA